MRVTPEGMPEEAVRVPPSPVNEKVPELPAPAPRVRVGVELLLPSPTVPVMTPPV